jgi:thioredoxin-dependent peroxiredoxin
MEGRRVPDIVFKTRVRDESLGSDNPYRWQDVTSAEVFGGRRVVVFSLPGAFTPTCSNEQCPAFERMYDEITATGVDDVICIAVNDAFVMHQWGIKLGVKRVRLLPDGSGRRLRPFHPAHGHADRQGAPGLWLSQLALCDGGQ